MPSNNRILDPGNMQVANPYFISGRTGILTAAAAAAPIATLINFGTVINGVAVPMSLHVSQIRLKYIPSTAPTAPGIAFEVLLGAATVQHTTGTAAVAHAAQPRARSFAPAIPLTEVNLFVAGTDAIGGGNFAPDDAAAPIDMMALGGGTTLAGAESIWVPADLSPIEIPQGRAIEVRARSFSATGILLVVFDFLR